MRVLRPGQLDGNGRVSMVYGWGNKQGEKQYTMSKCANIFQYRVTTNTSAEGYGWGKKQGEKQYTMSKCFNIFQYRVTTNNYVEGKKHVDWQFIFRKPNCIFSSHEGSLATNVLNDALLLNENEEKIMRSPARYAEHPTEPSSLTAKHSRKLCRILVIYSFHVNVIHLDN
jgi:hypothetical protein